MWKVRWKKWIKNCIEGVKIISLFRHIPASIPGILQEKLKDAGIKSPYSLWFCFWKNCT